MEIKKYPDGTSYAIAKDTHFTFKVNTYEELWHLNQMVDSCNAQGVKPRVTIPWLIDGQADKRFAPDQSSGLKLILRFLNSMNAEFRIFHPHNAETVEIVLDNVKIIDNKRFVSDVLYAISKGDKETYPAIIKDKYIGPKDYYRDARLDKKLVILLPDGGAYKWGAKLMDKLEWEGDVIAAAKNRQFVDGKSVLKQQLPDYDFKGKDVLILDDICIYGGTFKGLATMLKEKGCNKIYLAVSHLTVQNHDRDNVFKYFDKVFCTNSKYDVYYEQVDGNTGKKIENLEIIKMF